MLSCSTWRLSLLLVDCHAGSTDLWVKWGVIHISLLLKLILTRISLLIFLNSKWISTYIVLSMTSRLSIDFMLWCWTQWLLTLVSIHPTMSSVLFASEGLFLPSLSLLRHFSCHMLPSMHSRLSCKQNFYSIARQKVTQQSLSHCMCLW